MKNPDYKAPQPSDIANYFPKDKLRYHNQPVLLVKEVSFDSAHNLYEYDGKCRSLHGHTYVAQIGILGKTDERGLVIDFGDIKDMFKTHLEPHLDHKYLNQSLPPMNTSAENMVYWIYEQLDNLISEKYKYYELELSFVRLYETPTSYAEVRREWMEVR